MRRKRQVTDAIRETKDHGYGKFNRVNIIAIVPREVCVMPIQTSREMQIAVDKIRALASKRRRHNKDFLDTLATVIMGGPT